MSDFHFINSGSDRFSATCVHYLNVHVGLVSHGPDAHLYSLTSFFFNFYYTMVWLNTRFWLAAGCPL